MGSHFETETAVDFDEAIKKLSESPLVKVEDPLRVFLYGHKRIVSFDGRSYTQAGWSPRIDPDEPSPVSFKTTAEMQAYVGPKRIWFFKCSSASGSPADRQAARLFMVSIGTVLGVRVMTEYNEPVEDAEAWSVEYEFGEAV